MNPVCVKCQRFFRVKKNDFLFIEGMPVEDGAAPGTSEPEKWRPYKIWASDRYECEGCGAVILSGFARQPISEHYRPGFNELVRRLGVELQVNDC